MRLDWLNRIDREFVFAIIILIGLLVTWSSYTGDSSLGVCYSDADCVPAQCCHPTLCVHRVMAPDCTGIMCTQECLPGTMDCGQGRCACMDGRCRAVMGE